MSVTTLFTPVLSWSRRAKQAFALLADVLAALVAVWLAFYLRIEQVGMPVQQQLNAYAAALLFVPVFIRLGLYRAVFRYAGMRALAATAMAVGIYGSVFFAVLLIARWEGVPRSLGLIQPLVLLQSLLIHQTLLGNYPMVVRWLGHRYLLRQSWAFFQDEFAGRISQKLMQTALSLRETVMKLLDAFVYVVVYFSGTVLMAFSADAWLAVPLLVWLVGYVTLAWFFVPRLREISEAQSDARAQMTGRIVDS